MKREINTKKIAFIVCVNDELYYEECLFYIKRLRIPDGYKIEIIPVRNARSIYQAYNSAMYNSDAKYKVYMHQDVFLIYPDILVKFIELFEKYPMTGMAGVLGSDSIPEDKYFYKSWNYGNVLVCNEERAFHNELRKNESKVVAIDGMFMVTQYDIAWRDDALEGWDFYDFSQSMEFLLKGYEIRVVEQDVPWCIHDCGYLNFYNYDLQQKRFLDVYNYFFPDYRCQRDVYPLEYRQRFELMMELKEQLKILLFEGYEAEVRDVVDKIRDERFFDTDFAILINILSIIETENKEQIAPQSRFLYDCNNFMQACIKYNKVKFILRREKYVQGNFSSGYNLEVSESSKSIIRQHTMV